MPKVLVPSEHHVLKDLPFYKEARATNVKARQDQLNQREKKRQEGTLRQAPSVGCSATSSTVHPSTKKRPILWPTERALDLSLSSSSPSLSSEVGTNQDSIGSLLVRDSPNRELEPIVSCIILEPKKKKRWSEPKGRFQGEAS